MARDDVKLFILCNPHNPTGRDWKKEELEKIADLGKKYDLWIISDEFHCDLRRKDAPRHIPLGKIMPSYNKLITSMAATKSFNIAGLAQSSIIIRSDQIKDRWMAEGAIGLNPLNHEASIAAYEKGVQWLSELNDYLDGNFKFLEKFLDKNLADVILSPAQTTYLAWLDFSEYFDEDDDLELFFAKNAAVLVEADKTFVDHANRMLRINLACPRSYLKEGLKRMTKALKDRA